MKKQLSKYKKIVCPGIGGGAVYQVAKLFNRLNIPVLGFEINKSEKTSELEKLGIRITYKNPESPMDKDTDLIIYSNALPNDVISNLKKQNKNCELIEVGVFYNTILDKLDNKQLTKIEIDAIKKVNFAPLFDVDYSKMKYIGITGTDGKTTTATMLYHILTNRGYKVGLINTVGAIINGKQYDTGFHTTTPSQQEIFDFIKLMEKQQCTHVILEITSHALTMGRVSGIKLDVAVYTNITHEHLDYHKTFLNYKKAKLKLIQKNIKKDAVVILNKDDKNSFSYLKKHAQKTLFYTLSDFKNISVQENHISFWFSDKQFTIPLTGIYNLSNAYAATMTASVFNIKREQSFKILESFRGVEGRMEILQTKPFTVIVDFAHTPNALKQLLTTWHSITKNSNRKIITVFGCAGKRDTTKRSPMGKISGTYSDITILTAEDPRTEDLKAINAEIEKGWQAAKNKGHKLYRLDDTNKNVNVRRDAIKKALELAKENDVVLICGKAHEKSLCFGTTEYAWNDIEETKKLLIN